MENKELNFILFGVVWPPLLVIGIISNIINILVLQRRTLRSSTTVYLLFLSISYFCEIIVCILRVTQAYPDLQQDTDFHIVTGIYHVYFRYSIGNILVCFCNWLTVAMAFERCLVVGCVFKARHICTRRNAYIVCTVILLVSICANAPRFFEYVPFYGHNTTKYAAIGPLGANRTEAYTYFTIVFLTFLPFGFLVPFSTMVIILLTCHIRKLKALDVTSRGRNSNTGLGNAGHQRQHRKKTRENRMESNHRSVTILVIASNLMYLLCFGTSVYLYFQSATLGRSQALKTKRMRELGSISDTLILANASFSSLLYCGCSSVYRHEAYTLLRYGCTATWCCCAYCKPPPTRHLPLTTAPPLTTTCHTNDRCYVAASRKPSALVVPPNATSVSVSSNASNIS